MTLDDVKWDAKEHELFSGMRFGVLKIGKQTYIIAKGGVFDYSIGGYFGERYEEYDFSTAEEMNAFLEQLDG